MVYHNIREDIQEELGTLYRIFQTTLSDIYNLQEYHSIHALDDSPSDKSLKHKSHFVFFFQYYVVFVLIITLELRADLKIEIEHQTERNEDVFWYWKVRKEHKIFGGVYMIYI